MRLFIAWLMAINGADPHKIAGTIVVLTLVKWAVDGVARVVARP